MEEGNQKQRLKKRTIEDGIKDYPAGSSYKQIQIKNAVIMK